MNKFKLLLPVLLLLPFLTSAQTDILQLKSDVVDTIFGKVVPDPYRWMEYVNSEQVKQWLARQKEITATESAKYKKSLSSAKGDIEDFSGFSVNDAKKTGGWYFQQMYTLGTNASPILYYRESLNMPYEVAFDPNDISKIPYAINEWAVSDGGQYLAVALSPAGSDWREIHIRDIKSEKNLADEIHWVRFSTIVWWKDGFFYARYDKPATGASHNEAVSGQQLYYHKLGDKQDNDKLIVILSDQNNSTIGFQLSGSKRYLIIRRCMKISNKWYEVIESRDLSEGLFAQGKLLVSSPLSGNVFYEPIDFIDGNFYFLTNYGAPNKRVLRCNPDSTNKFTEVIPESDKVLQSVSRIYHKLVAVYFTAGQYQIYMYNYEGHALHAIKFDPGIKVSGFDGEPGDSVIVFYQQTFYMPLVIFKCNLKTYELSPVNVTHVHFDVGKYTTEVVNYKSKDGTMVPMYLTYKKGTKLNNNNPVILEGYGGYGISQEPYFKYENILFFDNKGILAVPMIRGGGELGTDWHEAGRRLHKQNSFDDFIAAAGFLVSEGYTSKEKLAIRGGSNGGLLVAAVMVQRPDLCKVVVARAGVFDMLRYDKFNGGKYWLGEYGSPQYPEDFENLFSYSPYHNLKPNVVYPATLLIAGSDDNRVAPFHSYKLLASLQEKTVGDNPHILYFENNAGHNGQLGLKDRQEEDAFELAFIFEQMHLPLKFF